MYRGLNVNLIQLELFAISSPGKPFKALSAHKAKSRLPTLKEAIGRFPVYCKVYIHL
jgi:hypothetical protein